MSTPIIKTPLRDRNRSQSQNNKEYHISRELMDIRKKLNNERARADDMELEVKSKDSIIKKLREELDMAKKRVHSQNDEMANMVSLDVHDKLKSEFEVLKVKQESIFSDLKFAQTQVRDLEEELRCSWASNQELSVKFEGAMKDMENIAREFVDYTDLKAKYEDLSQRYQATSMENEELQKALEAIKEQRKEDLLNESGQFIPLGVEMPALDAEPVSLFTEIMLKDQEEELEKVKISNEKMKNELDELKPKVLSMDRLQQEVETLNAQLILTKSRLSDSYRDLKNCISKREADKRRSAEQIKKLEQKSAHWEKELTSLRKTCNDLITRNGELTKLCNGLEAKVRELSQQNSVLESEVKLLDESFMMERRTKERYADENRHLEKMLQMEQIKLSQSVIMPPPPPPPSSISSASSSSSTMTINSKNNNNNPHQLSNSTINNQNRIKHNETFTMSTPIFPKTVKKSAPSSHYASSSISSCSSTRSSFHDMSKKRRPLPPGTGRSLPMADEEGEFMDPRNLEDLKSGRCLLPDPEDPFKRLSILQGRNSLCRPHLKSSYPVEMQDINVSESAIRQGSNQHERPSRPKAEAFTISFN
ncbi:CAP-Gly domain-containing linker protein 1-like [Panonychus citri]|uniref:CAP-Gly domain-containing linker protein 1-like n=1 Tax=Panonychus citri TaxID=50023 RepID=UPI002307DC31|nr:CAP-Gly domain-containing linker protein 1-like [Panonychus citri]